MTSMNGPNGNCGLIQSFMDIFIGTHVFAATYLVPNIPVKVTASYIVVLLTHNYHF